MSRLNSRFLYGSTYDPNARQAGSVFAQNPTGIAGQAASFAAAQQSQQATQAQREADARNAAIAQQQQIAQDRREVQAGVDKGFIATGLPIGTPEQIFRLAGIANQREELETRKQQAATEKTLADNALQLGVKVNEFMGQLKPLYDAITSNATATQALADKDWNVYVSTPTQPTPVPLPRV